MQEWSWIKNEQLKPIDKMFDNWTTKKTIWTLVVIGLLVAAYNWKWIAGKLGIDTTRKYCGGGLIQSNPYIDPIVGATTISTYEQGGLVKTGCGGVPGMTSSGIPIEIVPYRA